MKTIPRIFTVIIMLLVCMGAYVGITQFQIIDSEGESLNLTNGAADVAIQDQYTRPLDLRFIRATQSPPTTLTAATVIDDTLIVVADTTGFRDGTYILIADTLSAFYLGTQQGAPNVDTLTVDAELDRIYPAGSTVLASSYDMTVAGSKANPITFQVGSTGLNTEFDITRMMGYMFDSAVMRDDLFGSLPELTNGCILRIRNGVRTNIWTVKSNADLALLGYDLTYPDKVPAGDYSCRFRITYAGQEKHGVTLRLGTGDSLEFIIQDDLTGLEVFNMMAQGHIVE